jgi:2-haloacid dehalogenase
MKDFLLVSSLSGSGLRGRMGEATMIDNLLLSMSRRKLLSGLGTVATSGVAASVIGQAEPTNAQERWNDTVVPSILAFDINESTLDIQHLAPVFQRVFGDGKFVNEWYAQLVLYSEAIDLAGGPYTPFFDLSAAVLKYMGSIHNVPIQKADIDELGTRSMTMPPHPDVPAGLTQLKEAGFRLVTLTNSPAEVQVKQLKNAGIDGFYDKFFSVDGVRRYKPAPQVYHMAAEELHVPTSAICLISVHVWDNLGAQNAGCQSALVARPGNAPPPAMDLPGWPSPAAVGPDLPSVATQLIKLWR